MEREPGIWELAAWDPPSAVIPATVVKNEPLTSVCQSMSFEVSVTAPTSTCPVNCAANGTAPNPHVFARSVSAGITALAGPSVTVPSSSPNTPTGPNLLPVTTGPSPEK